MLPTLRMVSGAVADTDIVPIMTCLWFKNGRVQANGGRIAIDAPFTRPELDGKCIDAKKMLRMIALCDREPRFSVEGDALVIHCARKTLRLLIQADDKFRKVPQPPAESNGYISLSALRTLKPFISQDASKPFSITVLLKGGYAYATNNPALVRIPVEYQGPTISIRASALTRYCG